MFNEIVERGGPLAGVDKIIERILFDEMVYDDYSTRVMDNWEHFGFIKKDVLSNEVLKVLGFFPKSNNKFIVKCNNSVDAICSFKKEIKFFEALGFDFKDYDDFVNWLGSDEYYDFIEETDLTILVEVEDQEIHGSLLESYKNVVKEEFFKQIKNPTNVYKCRVLDKNKGGFIVELNGLQAFLPGGLASANRIFDFDALIDTEILVMIEDYLKEGDIFVVSNKKYIQRILPETIKNLDFNKKYTGIVTGCSKFGIFLEFEDILTGLLHVLEMDDDTKGKFSDDKNTFYKPGEKVDFYIKEIQGNNRIILTHYYNENNTKNIFENFKKEYEEKYLKGTIVNIDFKYGCFIKFNFNDKELTGLLHRKNLNPDSNFNIGDEVTTYITKVDTETNKIYLTIK